MKNIMKNLMKIKLRKINKFLRHSGLEIAVNYVPSGRKDTFLTLNWIGDRIAKEYLEEKLTHAVQAATNSAVSFINKTLIK